MSTAPNPHAPGTVLASKFRIVRELGVGGMGAVYEIEHELTKHRRALKLLHADVRLIPNVVERFLREASAAGRIGDPHIIETFDAGSLESGEPYVVMELLKGETLAARLEREGRFELGALAELIGQACEGVQAAHEAGIVHRDLKPDNLFVVERAGAPFVKILDFGVSKFDVELTGGLAVTRDGAVIGTPLYMPPEQVRGERDLDARADVYALGVILYECAAGKPPFEASSLPHLAVLIHAGDAPPLSAIRPDLPPALHEIVARAMAVDRAQRTQTARELGRALRELAARVAEALAATAPEGSAPSELPARSTPPTALSPAPSSPPAPPPKADDGKPDEAREALTSTAMASTRLPAPARSDAREGTSARGYAAAALGVLVAGGIAALAWPSREPAPAARAPTVATREVRTEVAPPVAVTPSATVVPGPPLERPPAEAPDAGAAAVPAPHDDAARSARATATASAPGPRGPSASPTPPPSAKVPLATENPFR